MDFIFEPNTLGKIDDLPQPAPGEPGGLAGPLDEYGLLPTAQLPQIAITDTFVVANQAERLALAAQVGDVAIQTDDNTTYILQVLPASTNSNWVDLPQQPYTTSTHGGSGNAGKLLALDADGEADGRNLQADGQKLDTIAPNAIASVTTSGAGLSGAGTVGSPLVNAGVTTFNTRTGAVTLTKADVTATGLNYADVGADASGAAAAALSTANSNLNAHINDTTDAHLATAIGYTPSVSGDWSPAPTTDAGGLNQLASRVKTLETTPTGVSSFNARTGAVAPADGDYSQNLITGLKTSSSPSFVAVTSSVSTGTAPFTVSSTTKVANLNADQVDGFGASQTPTASTIPAANSGNSQIAQGWVAVGTATSGYVPISNGDGTTSWGAQSVSTSEGNPGGTGVLVYTTSPPTVTLALNETQNLVIGEITTPSVQVTGLYVGSAATNVTYSGVNMTTEAQYVQEDATDGTDFYLGICELHCDPPRMVILLHGDGSNGSTTVTDNGATSFNHIWSAQNGAQISTAQSKFGGSSWLFNGTNSYLNLSANTDMLFTGDFTLGTWVYPTTITGDYRIILCNSTTGNFQFIINPLGGVEFYQGGSLLCATPNGALTTGSWQYVALIRSGSTVTIRVDGSVAATGTLSGTVGSTLLVWYWGFRANSNQHPFAGYMDEITVQNGVANTTVPGTQYSVTYPATGYWVTTGTSLALPTAKIANFDSATFTQQTPTSTQVRWLVSWDGGMVWKNHSGSTVALSDIHTSGSTATQMSTYFTALTPPTGSVSLSWAFGLKTTDTSVTPSVDSVSVQYDETAPWIQGINGTDYSVKVWTGEAGVVEFKSLRGSSTTWSIRAEIV
jgi:hypothetical protein